MTLKTHGSKPANQQKASQESCWRHVIDFIDLPPVVSRHSKLVAQALSVSRFSSCRTLALALVSFVF